MHDTSSHIAHFACSIHTRQTSSYRRRTILCPGAQRYECRCMHSWHRLALDLHKMDCAGTNSHLFSIEEDVVRDLDEPLTTPGKLNITYTLPNNATLPKYSELAFAERCLLLLSTRCVRHSKGHGVQHQRHANSLAYLFLRIR